MLSLCFNNSIFQAVDFLYSGKFIEEMFKGKRNYWDEEMLAEEIRFIANAQGKEPFSIHRGNLLTAHRYGLIYNLTFESNFKNGASLTYNVRLLISLI